MGASCCTRGIAKRQGYGTILVPSEPHINEKWCAQCRQYRKVPDEWHSNIGRYDGVGTDCKLCNNRNRIIRRQKRRIEV